MSILDTWILGAAPVFVVALAIAYFLPRFSTYFLGPFFLLVGAALFITQRRYFFGFHSEGSNAGLIVPGILWLLLISCCLLGLMFIVTGYSRVRGTASPASAEQPIPAELVKNPTSHIPMRTLSILFALYSCYLVWVAYGSQAYGSQNVSALGRGILYGVAALGLWNQRAWVQYVVYLISFVVSWPLASYVWYLSRHDFISAERLWRLLPSGLLVSFSIGVSVYLFRVFRRTTNHAPA